MADRKRQESVNDGEIDGEDLFDSEDVSTIVGSAAGSSRADGESSGSGSRIGLADRLSEILVEDGDGDLLLEQSGRESNFLQWLQALNLQVMGACRADERLKPLLKVNTSSGAAEDHLLAHLSEHFEASEVGLLARCLCVPLVSMRVGKVVKQGSVLCPTSVRGNLNLTLLPSSDLRISFVGDNGQTERLATLSDISQCSAVVVDEISADQSGRSFVVKLPDGETFYFWCSEKSKLLGSDLLSKMKDLLKSKPTLAELTGISESRLECFATRLRSHLVGPSMNNILATSTTSPSAYIRPYAIELDQNTSSSPTPARSLRTRSSSGQTLKGHMQYQGSLSPRSSSFKEGLPKTLPSLRSTSREKPRYRGDLHLPTVDCSFMTETIPESGKHSEVSISSPTSPLSFLESLGNPSVSASPRATSQLPPIGSLFSPHYCWCPPRTSSSMASISKLPTSLNEPFSLPPLSTLLPATGTQIPPPDLAAVPPLELPALLSDPLARLPFTNQSTQLPTFTPLMCDPIVHIPVVDICSSGQGYLVSAGPGIATSIPPLHPKLVGTMIPDSESVVEKGARETLRLLISGSSGQPSVSLRGPLPTILNNEDKQGVVVAGSRGLYSGVNDIDAIVNGFTTVGLTSVSERSVGLNIMKSFSDVAGSDALELTTSSDVDFQDSSFMSIEEDKN